MPDHTAQTQKARETRLANWGVNPAQKSVRGRLRIPVDLVKLWDSQDTDDRGMSWAVGCILTNPAASYIIGSDEVTVILGQHSATAPTQYEAIVSLIKSYGYDIAPEYGIPQNDLEARLTELDLLE